MRELIVTFHGFGEPPAGASEAERRTWLPVGWLDPLLDALPRRQVRLTFDDGNRSDIKHALPALARHERQATFFVPAGELDKPGRLAREHVSRLRAAGMEIGSHGLHHRDWRRLSDEALERELAGSRSLLAGILDGEVREAACPFGSDRRVLRALREAGYSRVYTSDGGPAAERAWLAPRTTINRDRPLDAWLEFLSRGPQRRPLPVRSLKRCAKRWRGAPRGSYERYAATAAAR
jgi:peptidoglycan/xylan/chitin deacetylase (PgdA/CDA1 family)